mmetsp:Transcript_5687/g.9766  ORF Transcript_5687/g.9766 Transcript_5687/m.9766 type:complete len:385 (-) Transcript_5687:18-1172(-)
MHLDKQGGNRSERQEAQRRLEEDLDNLLKQHEKFINFTDIPPVLAGGNQVGEKLTSLNFDKSELLNFIISHKYRHLKDTLERPWSKLAKAQNEEDQHHVIMDQVLADLAIQHALGEFQLAFVEFVIGENLSAFEQWKKMLIIFCNCESALTAAYPSQGEKIAEDMEMLSLETDSKAHGNGREQASGPTRAVLLQRRRIERREEHLRGRLLPLLFTNLIPIIYAQIEELPEDEFLHQGKGRGSQNPSFIKQALAQLFQIASVDPDVRRAKSERGKQLRRFLARVDVLKKFVVEEKCLFQTSSLHKTQRQVALQSNIDEIVSQLQRSGIESEAKMIEEVSFIKGIAERSQKFGGEGAGVDCEMEDQFVDEDLPEIVSASDSEFIRF